MEAREPESSRRVCVSDNQSLVTEPAVLVTLAVLGSTEHFDLKISPSRIGFADAVIHDNHEEREPRL